MINLYYGLDAHPSVYIYIYIHFLDIDPTQVNIFNASKMQNFFEFQGFPLEK